MTLPGIDIDVKELIGLRHHVGALEVKSRKRALSLLSGNQVSPFKGRGIDFEEVRRYQAGDDVRHMDWRVTARTGHPHLKLFREERERPVFFLVDFSASMLFGTKVAFKSVVAAQAASLLAWASMKKGDRVGAVLSSEQGHKELRPAGGRGSVLRLIHAMADLHAVARNAGVPQQQESLTPLASSMNRIIRTVRPGSQIFLVSDFVGLDAQCESAIARLRVHNELVCIMPFDPLEATPPPPGMYKVSDGIRSTWLDTARDQTVDKYRQQYQVRQNKIQALCIKLGLGFFTLATNQSVPDGVREGLRQISSRRWHHHTGTQNKAV
ncbi:MAG: DUF58 domain-containing protein [Nitrospirae bacterium]|nr:DUF58 domain-containing protein [Nitrospirota bacterium]MDA1304282.1 DUF58 domain-containing protein [Nitrospirota bacterium]